MEWNRADRKSVANAKNNAGDTPLHLAASKNSMEMVTFLANKGADIRIKNYQGRMPFELAQNECKNFLQ